MNRLFLFLFLVGLYSCEPKSNQAERIMVRGSAHFVEGNQGDLEENMGPMIAEVLVEPIPGQKIFKYRVSPSQEKDFSGYILYLEGETSERVHDFQHGYFYGNAFPGFDKLQVYLLDCDGKAVPLKVKEAKVSRFRDIPAFLTGRQLNVSRLWGS